MSAFEPIRSVLKDVSKGSALGLKLSQVRLQQEWENLVGKTIAKHSYPESIRFKKLYLIADNSIWLQQLVFLKPSILKAMHSLMPELEVTDIVLHIGTLPQNPHEPEPEPSPSAASPLLPSSFAMALTEQLTNPELQAILAKTITKSLTESPTPTVD